MNHDINSPHAIAALVALHGAARVSLAADLFARGHSVRDVASLFGITRQAAWNWRRRLCIETHIFLVHPEVAAIAAEPVLHEVAS